MLSAQIPSEDNNKEFLSVLEIKHACQGTKIIQEHAKTCHEIR